MQGVNVCNYRTGAIVKTRRLGNDGPVLSEIGFGAWAIGGAWQYGWGPVDDNDSIKAIHTALDLGINWIDTAAQYGLGHSEKVVGRALRGKREDVFVATKCGQPWDENGNCRTHAGADSIRKEIEGSLRRLETDYIDLYQIHWPDWDTPVEESWGALAALQDEGKVRHIGVCNFGVDLMERCEPIRRVQSLQPIYNLLERDIEREIIPHCVAHSIGVVAYSPMQSGLLSGSFNRASVAPDDWRIVHSEKFREPKYSRGLRLVEELRPMASRYNRTVGQLAISWALMNKAVTSAIVGARNPEQVRQNVLGAETLITPEDMSAIEMLLNTQ